MSESIVLTTAVLEKLHEIAQASPAGVVTVQNTNIEALVPPIAASAQRRPTGDEARQSRAARDLNVLISANAETLEWRR